MKMDAHITEVHRQTSTSNNALSGTVFISTEPSRIFTSGMVVVTLFGVRMAAMMSTIPKEVQNSIIWREDTLPPMALATIRPTSISSQYMAATAPPMVAALSTASGFTQAPLALVSER